MFTLEEIECIISKAEETLACRGINMVRDSCFTTTAKLSFDDIALWQLLYLAKRNPSGLDTCLINKLRKA